MVTGPPISLEHQWDEPRGQITLVATKGFGGDRYAVTVPAATPAEAIDKWSQWRALYGEAPS